MNVRLATLLTGAVAPLGPGGVTSAIAKTPRRGLLHLRFDGLEGDAQADRMNHGGTEKPSITMLSSIIPCGARNSVRNSVRNSARRPPVSARPAPSARTSPPPAWTKRMSASAISTASAAR